MYRVCSSVSPYIHTSAEEYERPVIYTLVLLHPGLEANVANIQGVS